MAVSLRAEDLQRALHTFYCGITLLKYLSLSFSIGTNHTRSRTNIAPTVSTIASPIDLTYYLTAQVSFVTTWKLGGFDSKTSNYPTLNVKVPKTKSISCSLAVSYRALCSVETLFKLTFSTLCHLNLFSRHSYRLS